MHSRSWRAVLPKLAKSGRAKPAIASIVGLWLALILASDVALASPIGQETAASEGGAIWPILLAMFAASTGVELGIELLWNYVDWFLLNARGWQPANLRSAQYRQFKSGTSLLLGAVAGILVAKYLGMQLFASLMPYAPQLLANVPPAWDVVITGLLIGAGTKPVHDLLGIITGFKNWLGASAIKQRESAGAALAEGVLKLAQSDAQSMIDVPGVGPTRLHATSHAGIDMLDGEESAEEAATVERYADVLRNRTAL